MASVTVDNQTVPEILCNANNIAAALSDGYACPVNILGVITPTQTVDCPFFVCPCGVRRLLAAETTVRIIFQYTTSVVNTSKVVASLQTALGITVRDLITLATNPDSEWRSVSRFIQDSAPASNVLIIAIGGAAAAVVCGAVITTVVLCRRKAPPPPSRDPVAQIVIALKPKNP